MQHPAINPPMLTHDIPGVGGRIRAQVEDFEVEEISSYPPSGTGEHLYLWLEKRSIGPEHLTRMLAQKLGISVRDIGTAGLKDRHAITRQWVSVPVHAEANLKKIDGDGLKLLEHARHANKLKPGHLKGNRFRILIREPNIAFKDNVERILNTIREIGMPNYYGPQRFGHDGSTLDLGFRCLAGLQSRRIRPFQYKFALSAVQSLLFNDYLARRMNDGFYRKVLLGDVMTKRETGGLFVVQDQPVEQARFDAGETVMCGPMFGKHTFAAAEDAAEREANVLVMNKVAPNAFEGFGKLMSGTRRHNMIFIKDLQQEWEPEGLRLSFSMPSGSYATVLLREVMKNEIAEPEPEPDDESSEPEA